MPVDRRKRPVKHVSRRDTRSFAVQENAVEHVDVGTAEEVSVHMAWIQEADVILNSLSNPDQPVSLKKKEKQHLRHEALLHRLGVTNVPYSKSHMRRVKRKAKEQLSADLTAVGEAIAAVEAQNKRNPMEKVESKDSTSQSKPVRGQIGEGKHTSLTTNQRKRTFQAENLRHKLILANHDFASNPFKTIRTHAQNTLVKHQE